MHVASSWRLRRDEAEDGLVNAMGYVGHFYLKIDAFYILATRDNLVFSLLIGSINKNLEG
jgi:hypothetical protein